MKDKAQCKITGEFFPMQNMTKTMDGHWVHYSEYSKGADSLRISKINLLDLQISKELKRVTSRKWLDTLKFITTKFKCTPAQVEQVHSILCY